MALRNLPPPEPNIVRQPESLQKWLFRLWARIVEAGTSVVSSLYFSATQRVAGRNSAGAGSGEEITASQLMDWVGSTRGAILYRGASGWAILIPGNLDYPLVSNGVGADPAYEQLNLASAVSGDLPFANIVQISTNRLLGRVTVGTGDIEELTAAQVASIINSSLDHGTLLGLADDDHTQYLLVAGTRALTGNWDAGSFEIRAQTFQSDVVTGTAPLIIASTTAVANLNADLLDGQHASAFQTTANSWTRVNKTSDQSKTSDTTLANDSALIFTMSASTNYQIRGFIGITSAATPDFDFRITGPAATLVRFTRQFNFAGTLSQSIGNAYDAADINIDFTGITQSYLMFNYMVQNGGAGGTFAFQWAQTTSSATATTVHAGSFFEYAVIA